MLKKQIFIPAQSKKSSAVFNPRDSIGISYRTAQVQNEVVARFDQRKRLRQTLQKLKLESNDSSYANSVRGEAELNLSERRSSKVEVVNDEYSGERLVLNLRNLPREITRNNSIVQTEQNIKNSRKERSNLINPNQEDVYQSEARNLSDRGKQSQTRQ